MNDENFGCWVVIPPAGAHFSDRYHFLKTARGDIRIYSDGGCW